MNDRRRFLKYTGLVAGGLATGSVKGWTNGRPQEPFGPAGIRPPGPGIFNMCGYAVPKIDTIRIGFIGLGNRGSEAVPRIIHIDGVDVRALCDIRADLVEQAKNELKGTSHEPALYSGSEEVWK